MNLLQRFEVQEKKATPLGKIMNSSISSIQSDNKPPKRPVQEGKKNSKLQEEIENHVKSQTKMVEKELAGEWNEILEQCLNEEISQAEEILTEEIEAFVLKTIAENFSKLKETSLSEVDENYRAKGFKIVPTQVRTGFSPMFSLNRQGRTKKTIEKVRIESDDVAFDSTLTDTNDLRLEVVKFIERSIENLADKFERLSQNVIANEINQRIQRMKGMICGEVQEFIAETVHAVRFELEQCVQERIKEIVGANQDRHEAPYREQFAKRYSPAEQNYKPKYEENYEFIENLANNYSGMKSNAETQNMAGNYTQEHKTFKKVAKKAEKPSIPRTDVSSVLQQFLKK